MEITLTYTEALVRRAVRRFCLRSVGVLYPIAVGVTVAGLVAMLARGDRSWIVGVLGSITAFGLVLPVVFYRTHLAHSLARLAGLQGQSATLRMSDAGFAIEAVAGSSILSWSAVTEIWQFDDCWLLVFSKSQFMTVPIGGASNAAKAMLAERVVAHGGRVLG